jgi:hypothetical protein
MPIHAHHRPERLEPERMGEAAQQLIATIVVDDGLADHRPQPRHSISQPWRHAAAMQG